MTANGVRFWCPALTILAGRLLITLLLASSIFNMTQRGCCKTASQIIQGEKKNREAKHGVPGKASPFGSFEISNLTH